MDILNERTMEVKFNFYKFSLVELLILIMLVVLLSIALFRTPVAVTYIDDKLKSHALYTAKQVETIVTDVYTEAAGQGYLVGGQHALSEGIDSAIVSVTKTLPHRKIQINFLLSESLVDTVKAEDK